MARTVRMPEVLAGASEATLLTWLVAPGDQVTVGQVLAEAETEKALVELPSEYEGVVGSLLVKEGDAVELGVPIVVLLEPGETEVPAIDTVVSPSAAPTPDQARRLFASPLVRRIAAEEGIDLGDVTGSGPNGRIVRRDLTRHTEAQQKASLPTSPVSVPTLTEAAHVDVPLDRMRKAIARRLTESKATVPHFYLAADCRVDALLELRAQVNATAVRKVSVNDFVLKAVASALLDVPVANAIWNGESIRRFSSVDLAVAVATDGGLLTPVIRGVEQLTLTAISETVAELAERARAGRLKQQELEGGSFAVSNLGMYGTQEFSAILNPPQSGILAVGAARRAPVVGVDGELAIGSLMTVTLSADHRVLDGAVAAQWLAAFQRRIENPLTILI